MLAEKIARGLLLAAALVFAPRAAGADEPAAWRGRVTDFAAAHFKHPAWGFSHSQRDYALARSLAAADHVTLDDDVLFAAAYLHDMAAFPEWAQAGKDHGDVAAAKIGIVLDGTDFPKAKLEAVRAAIATHMYYRDPVGPEARYLHDADALDWLGAIGIARDMALVDNKGGKPLGPDAVANLERDLKAVPPRIVTPAGRAQIAPRVAEENAFLAALRRETGDLSTF